MTEQLPSRDELAEMLAARRRDQQQRDQRERQRRKPAQEDANRNLNLFREFADRARADDLPAETIEVVSGRGFLRRKRRTLIAGWDIGPLLAGGTPDRWLLASASPPFWWKVREHNEGGKLRYEAEQVPLEKGTPLWGPAPDALTLALTQLLLDLAEKKHFR